jgi:glycosyltransferase involved in cell wall biosynthesis
VTAPAAVTVVVPVWDDYVALLPACLDSILDQPERPQVIVVDNASTTTLPALPPTVEVVRLQRRVSVGAARNAGLERVATPYVLFCDADDRMLPGSVEFLRGRLEADPSVVTAVGRFLSFNPRTGEVRLLARMPRPIVARVSRHRRVFALAGLRYNCFLLVGCLHRTATVRAVGGFGDGNVGEDWVLGALLAFRGRLDFTGATVFRHRVEEGSLWNRRHSRTALASRSAQLRGRVRRDSRVPRWVKASLPLLSLVHAYDVRRSTKDGFVSPDNELLGEVQHA